MLRILQEIKKFDIVYRIREQVRKAAIGLVFCEDDGYISRYRFRAQQGSLSRLSVLWSKLTMSVLGLRFWEVIKSTRLQARSVMMGRFCLSDYVSICLCLDLMMLAIPMNIWEAHVLLNRYVDFDAS